MPAVLGQGASPCSAHGKRGGARARPCGECRERRTAAWDFAPEVRDRAGGPCAAAVVTEDGERAERATLAPGPAPIDLGPGEAFAYILPAR